MIKAIGGRKVLVGLLILAAGLTLEFTIGLSTGLVTLLMFTGAGFFVGNSVEHISGAIRHRPHQGVALTEVDHVVKAFSAQMAQTTVQVEAIQNSVELTNKAATAIIERLNESK